VYLIKFFRYFSKIENESIFTIIIDVLAFSRSASGLRRVKHEFAATQCDTISAVIYSLTSLANSINKMQLCISHAPRRRMNDGAVNMHAKLRELKVCAFWLIGRHATYVLPSLWFRSRRACRTLRRIDRARAREWHLFSSCLNNGR